MIKVTEEQFHEHVASTDNEIVFTGPPSSLKGTVTLQNSTDEHMMIRALPVTDNNEGIASLAIKAALKPRELKMHNVRYAMDPLTAPGTYHMNVQIGNENKKVKMIVHENLDVQFSPMNIVLVGVNAGMEHKREIMMTNKSNIPVTVPNVKHNTLTDMDLICRNLSRAIRAKGDEGIEKTLDEFTRYVKKDLGDWVEVSIEESGRVVQPGESLLLHLSLTIPNEANRQYQYTGEIRMFDKFLHYTIVDKYDDADGDIK